jgi:hypothetical protein
MPGGLPLMRPEARVGFTGSRETTGGFAMEVASIAVMAVLVGLSFGLIELCDRQ